MTNHCYLLVNVQTQHEADAVEDSVAHAIEQLHLDEEGGSVELIRLHDWAPPGPHGGLAAVNAGGE